MKKYKSLYKLKESNLETLYYKIQNRFGTKISSVKRDVLDPLFLNLRKYERESNPNYLLPLKKFAGLNDILFESKRYKLFRGLFLKKFEKHNNYSSFEEINKNQYSWTTSISQAEIFARGSTHYMDPIKLTDKQNYYRENYFGCIIEFEPSFEEILIDFEYCEKQYGLNFVFSENEVICFPKRKIFKVIKII